MQYGHKLFCRQIIFTIAHEEEADAHYEYTKFIQQVHPVHCFINFWSEVPQENLIELRRVYVNEHL